MKSADDRQRFLRKLDNIEQVIVMLYRFLLGLIIVAVIGVVLVVVLWRPWGAGNQGEWFYFSIAVLLVLGWAIGQLLWLRRRRMRRW